MDDITDARQVYKYEPDPYFTYRVSPKSIRMFYCPANATGLTRTVFQKSFYHNIPHHYKMYLKRAIAFTENGNLKMAFICKERMGPNTFLWYDFFRNQYEIIQLNQEITEKVSLAKPANKQFYLNDKKDHPFHGLVLGTREGPTYLLLLYRDKKTQQMRAEVERIPLELQDNNKISCIDFRVDVIRSKDIPRITIGCYDGSVYLYQFAASNSTGSHRLKKTVIDLSIYVEYKNQPIASLTSCNILNQSSKLLVVIGQNKPLNSDEFSILDACLKLIWINKTKPTESGVIYPPLVESTASLSFIALNLFITDDKKMSLGAVLSSGVRKARSYTLKVWEIKKKECELVLDRHIPFHNVESRYLYRIKPEKRRYYLESNYQLLVENILGVPYTTTVDNMYFSGEVTALNAARKDKSNKQTSVTKSRAPKQRRKNTKKTKKTQDDNLILNEGPSTSIERTILPPENEAGSDSESESESDSGNTTQNENTEQSNSEFESTHLDTSIEIDSDMDYDLDDGGYSPPAFVSSLSDIANVTFPMLDEGDRFFSLTQEMEGIDSISNDFLPQSTEDAFSIVMRQTTDRGIVYDQNSDTTLVKERTPVEDTSDHQQVNTDDSERINASTSSPSHCGEFNEVTLDTKDDIEQDEHLTEVDNSMPDQDYYDMGDYDIDDSVDYQSGKEDAIDPSFDREGEEQAHVEIEQTHISVDDEGKEARLKAEKEFEAQRAVEEEEKARLLAEEKALREVEEAEARRIAEEEEKARLLAEEEARREAEESEARRIAEEEEKARLLAEEKVRREAEEAEARRIAEEEEKARILAEEEARREAEEAEAQRVAEEEEKARLLAEEQARREAEEAEARRIAEEEEKARLLAEEEARREAEEAEAQRIAEEEARREAEEAEAQRVAEEEEKARLLAEEEARREAEEAEARRIAEEEEKARILAEEQARREAEEAEARRIAEEEEKARILAEEEARREAEEAEARRIAEEEEKARILAEEQARREAEEAEARRIAEEEEKARILAEEEARREAEEAEARRIAEEEEKARILAEEEARREAEAAEAQRIAEEEEKARLLAEEEARREAEEAEAQRVAEEEEKARLLAEEQARREAEAAEAQRIAEEEEKARILAEEEARREAEEAEAQRIAEEEAKAKLLAEEQARCAADESETKGKSVDEVLIASKEKNNPNEFEGKVQSRDVTSPQHDESRIKIANENSKEREKTLGKRAIELENIYQPNEKKLKQTPSSQEYFESRWNKHYNKHIVENSLHKYTSKRTIKDVFSSNLKLDEENEIGTLCWESNNLDLKLFLLDYCIKNKQEQSTYLVSKHILQGIEHNQWRTTPCVKEMCQEDCKSVYYKIHPVLRQENTSINPFSNAGKASIRDIKWKNLLGEMYNFISQT